MSPDEFSDQIQTLRRRCLTLWRDGSDRPHSSHLLTDALDELGNSLEELRVAEEELRQQNEMLALVQARLEAERARYQDLFQSAPEAYLVTDADGTVREANRRAHLLLGVGPRSLVGKSLAGFIPVEDRRDFRAFLAAPVDAVGGRARETRLMAPGRAPIAVSASVASDGGGTRRWLLRPLSTESELERFRLLVSEVRDYAIILTDPQGTILDWNNGAERIFGYTAGEVQGKPMSLLFTAADRAAGLPAREREQAAGEGRASDDHWLVRKDGSPVWVNGSLSPLHGDDGQVRWFAKVLQDRTEHRLHEQREHAVVTRLQAAVQPAAPAGLPGLAVRTFYRPALAEASVGGDFFDVFGLEDGRSVLAVGDVSGKGLEAAAQVGTLRNMLRAFLYTRPTAADALNELNHVLTEHELLAGFATLFVGVHDAATGRLVYVNCGQEPALLRRAATGHVERLSPTGPLLGMDTDCRFTERQTSLGPGDALAVFTDGLTDIGPSRVDMLGEAGVAALLGGRAPELDGSGAHRAADVLSARLAEVVEAQGPGGVPDDVCLLVAVAEAARK